ncbi:tyrosine-type recombinase/integrase [Acidithiobacillus ferrooxidans]|uniref:tyrosine-type recombinase/integrase n=1 Tax=Acidithiobacillus ferrooxidans TaxID=920 RepID=UPI0021F88D2E|nr:tyrosine-type recombinase/integrase [Acidithiobacillus ferrooxidans]
MFYHQRHPVTDVTTKAWYKALERADIPEGFRWHDLRHTWASWHAQNGTPLHVLQEMGGWSSPSTVKRYAHLSVQHLATYVENAACRRMPDHDTNTSQNDKPSSEQ